jgi:hypothetical protein
MNKIEVNVCGFDNLFDKKILTIIPEYQRSYIWGVEKADVLLNDLFDFFVKLNSQENYYLGSILFYNNNENLEIIDGQQRITTLLIMEYIINNNIDNNKNIKFNTIQSIKYIKEVQFYFDKNREILDKLDKYNFFNKLEFTKIITFSEDDAFSFFDTQNNRGVKLSPTDYLKAYHLRAINNFEKSEELQASKATEWENIGNQNIEPPLLDYLFERVLWRTRNWKGVNIRFENQDLILESFQKMALTAKNTNVYPFYKSGNNLKYQAVNWLDENKCTLIPNQSKQISYKDFPFSLRQPIHKGLNFFDYTLKYAEIFNMLFIKESNNLSIQIAKMRKYYNAVYSNDMSVFVRDFMNLLLVAFYDSFGEEEIYKAINHFDYILGSLRINLSKIKKESITKYLKESSENIIDLITTSYIPEEIFRFIQSQEKIEKTYYDLIIDEENKGVQSRYILRVLNYFHVTTLKERKSWLER